MQHPFLAVAAGDGLERDGVGAVIGLGEGECGEHLGARDRPQPPLLLLGAAVQCERAQREPALDGDDGAERAVAPRDLHRDQARGERRERRDERVLHAVVQEIELAQTAHEVEGVVGGIPRGVHAVADLVDERLRALPHGAVGVGDVGEHRVVVGAEALGHVVGRDGLTGEGHAARLPDTEYHRTRH